MTLELLGSNPPENTPLVELSKPAKNFLSTDKSPKSVALPVVDMVKYSIMFGPTEAGSFFPPPTIALVLELTPAKYSLSSLKFPKSAALPKVDMVT